MKKYIILSLLFGFMMNLQASDGSAAQPRASLFFRTFSAAQSTCSAIYQNILPLSVASVATATPYLVQKSGVALPSQDVMMLLPVAILSGKLLTKGEFPLVDTTSIVFKKDGKDKASLPDHVFATGIIHADTLCATGAAVTGVAACNTNNSWQATAGFAAVAGILGFGSYKISQFKRAFNEKFNQKSVRIWDKISSLSAPETATKKQLQQWTQDVAAIGDKWTSETPLTNMKKQAQDTLKEAVGNSHRDGCYNGQIKIYAQEVLQHVKDHEEYQLNLSLLRGQMSPQARQQEYVDQSKSVARQLLPWNTPLSK